MSSDVIKLNLVNASADLSGSSIVVFQNNVVPSAPELAVAWRVIENLGVGWNHPFSYYYSLGLGASDPWGNSSPLESTDHGTLWTVVRSDPGIRLDCDGRAPVPKQVHIRNGLRQGEISVNCYRGGCLVATKSGVAPGQLATFQFDPIIYVGAALHVEQGQVLDSVVSSLTELNLSGLVSADIVVSGGGTGPNAPPLTFALHNEVLRT